MFPTEQIGLYTVIWILLFGLTFMSVLRRRHAVGLTATFLITFLVYHWLGSALYLLPWQHLFPTTLIQAGLEQAVYGIVGFSLGALLFGPILVKSSNEQSILSQFDACTQKKFLGKTKIFLLIGTIFYFAPIFVPILSRIPTFNTAAVILARFMTLAAYLFVYLRIRSGSKKIWWQVSIIAGIFPVIGVITSGFVGFAFINSLLILMFYLSYSKINVKKVIYLLAVSYIGLSAFITYMYNRDAIREKMWGGASLSDRIQVILETASEFELFSLDDSGHFYPIEIRLNRNYYVGLAAKNINAGVVGYEMGKTYLDILIAPIPRALWPNKPQISGNNALATKFTGFYFDRSIVGTGPLFDSFVNFGPIGVLVTFSVFGVILSVADFHARIALDSGRYYTFALWTLPFVQMVDNISSIGSIIAPLIGTIMIFKLFQFQFEHHPGKPPAASQLSITPRLGPQKSLLNNPK